MSDHTNLILKNTVKRLWLQDMRNLSFELSSKFHSFAEPLAFFTVGAVIVNDLFNNGLMANFVWWSAIASAILLILSFIFICFELICAFKINKLTKK